MAQERALVEDTRQKAGRHEAKNLGWSAMGLTVVRHQLEVGDYALMPRCSVDTKQDIQELYSDVVHDHERFRRECDRAVEVGCQLIILTENAHGVRSLADLEAWVEPEAEFRRRRRAKERISGLSLARACRTLAERHGVWFAFCAPEEAARAVIDLLEDYERR